MTMEVVYMVSQSLAPWLAMVAAKATLVLGAALVIAYVMKNASPAARHFVWLLAMIAVVLLPLLSWFLPGWTPDTAQIFARPSGASATSTIAENGLRQNADDAVVDDTSVWDADIRESELDAQELWDVKHEDASSDNSIEQSLPFTWDKPGWLKQVSFGVILSWFTGTLLLIARTAAGLLALQRLERRSRQIHAGPLADFLKELLAARRLRRECRLLIPLDRDSVPTDLGPVAATDSLAARCRFVARDANEGGLDS